MVNFQVECCREEEEEGQKEERDQERTLNYMVSIMSNRQRSRTNFDVSSVTTLTNRVF